MTDLEQIAFVHTLIADRITNRDRPTIEVLREIVAAANEGEQPGLTLAFFAFVAVSQAAELLLQVRSPDEALDALNTVAAAAAIEDVFNDGPPNLFGPSRSEP